MSTKTYKLAEGKDFKAVRGSDYNFNFDKRSGVFVRWGKTQANEDDPKFSPIGPEIADIEISTVCSGVGKVCKFCYKSNTPNGENMSIDTFRKLADKFNKNLGQIAFGIGDLPQHKYYKKIIP
jgi:hypothetical protein